MRNHGQDPISRSIPIVATAYARKFGIKIGIGGGEAFTDGDHIQLPSIPEDYPYKDALWGFLAHEASHVRYTDFGVEAPNDYHHSLMNSLEDGRIELKFIREYPGAKETLDEALRLFVFQGKMEKPDGSEHPAQILSAYVLYWVRNQWRGQTILNDQYAAAAQAMDTVFPADVLAKLNVILAGAPNLQSTSDVKAMVDTILELFKDEAPEEQPDEKPDENAEKQPEKGDSDSNDQDGDSKDSGNGDSGDDQDDSKSGSSGSNSDQKGDGESGQDGQGGSSGDKSESNDGQSGSSGGSGQNDKDQSSRDQKPADGSGDQNGQQSAGSGQPSGSGQAGQQGGPGSGGQKGQNLRLVQEGTAKHAAPDVFGEIKEDLQTVAKGNPKKNVLLPPDAVPVGSLSEAQANELETRARSTTVALRKQLMALVQSKDKVQKRYDKQGLKVASNRLSGVTGGDFRIFRREKRTKKVNTAVHVLLDASGSMRGEEIIVANEAALAIAQALEAIPRVSVAVTAFQGGVASPVFEMLKHNQTARANAGRFAVGASGGTPLAPALWHAARDLCSRREERKIVMVITDGMPAMPDETKHVISLMQRSGYEVVGVGIGTNIVGSFISDHCVIQNASDLKHSLFDIFRKKLAA
ncbi:cobaltochelatase CobT-related protein [Marinobacter salicampi]|uniref:cobaltochelatase CobT-related protein n=1 Tax=Marinobacter salicampi TaxID=435907 RepID=UPI00140C9C53|nr:VWA domain-containing protein [Marinobacter salicampi]